MMPLFMKLTLVLLLISALALCAAEPLDPADPKRFREQGEVLEKEITKLEKVEVPAAPGLYRAWLNPVKKVVQPAKDSRRMEVISPAVKNPANEQTFFKNREWKPERVIHLYEKSKDFDQVLNPLSLRDFNRFVYQRNSKTP